MQPPWVTYHLTAYVIFGWASPANLAPGATPHCSWVIPLIPGMFNQAGRCPLEITHAIYFRWYNIKLFWIFRMFAIVCTGMSVMAEGYQQFDGVPYKRCCVF